ncbi:hypothetical protein CAOG_06011 [Capsaspora owczarzaki ATCC 30864]|uniref:Uncharacterized protein n=1 Tax=Capsaspora owczarzaki (strain ATCC 30864) TaxID=595528 RepID=A0A0D2WUG1_CAPO3|nr:hypothetical protein CAOG_06011 [Capsaspora owczarzaki ATCC 30864]KJE95568.1 hypothetical protein CAOG_006011 [Capsaspora owczarzaki ATCC 30864]|eukprot:XP_004345601.1 hypothetical protein CAOG_06011 [Capsaspora owczarzaki ATCC 30864]
MRFNKSVLFELVLVAACVHAVHSVNKHTHADGRERVMWTVGIGSIGVAAFLGAIVYSGETSFSDLHKVATRAGGTIGVAGLLLGSLITLDVLRPYGKETELMVLGAGLVAGVAVFITSESNERARKSFQVAVMASIIVVSLLKIGSSSAAIYLLASVLTLAAVDPLKKPLRDALNISDVDVYHIMLTLSVYLFGLAVKA